MKELAQLLAQWEAGTLSPEEVAELRRHLASPEGRTELIADWQLDEAIYDTLRSQPSPAPVTDATRTAEAKPVWKTRPRSRRFFRWLVWREARLALRWPLGFALAGCLVLLGFYAYYAGTTVGRVVQVRASVMIERGGRRISAGPGQLLYPGDKLEVPSGGSASLAWADEPTRLDLASSTQLKLLNPMRGKKLSLSTGLLRATVAPQPRWRPMTIQTPQAEAKVVGTQFSLAATGEVTRLEVLEGAVLFRKLRLTAIDRLTEVLVHAGEVAGAEAGLQLETRFMTGFLSSDLWDVRPGTSLAETPARGAVLRPLADGTLPPGAHPVERLRGYVVAPVSGDFVFWIAPFNASTSAELWLSSDEDPRHKRRVAYARPPAARDPGSELASPPRPGLNAALTADWRRAPSQKSLPQKLVRGRRYYLEIWHEGHDISSLAMGWTVPGQPGSASPRMVDRQALCPFIETKAEP